MEAIRGDSEPLAKKQKQAPPGAAERPAPSATAFKTAPMGSSRHPFEVDKGDHCETSEEAYEQIAPLLAHVAESSQIGKSRARVKIYDPYFCDGAVVRRLAKQGFLDVYNKCEDFYDMAGNQPQPHPNRTVDPNPNHRSARGRARF